MTFTLRYQKHRTYLPFRLAVYQVRVELKAVASKKTGVGIALVLT